MRDMPYLVQRIKRIADGMELDYMGAAEFEYGIIPKTRQAMQKENKKEPYVIKEILVAGSEKLPKGASAFYLGPPSRFKLGGEFFTREVHKDTRGLMDRDLKEVTNIWRVYQNNPEFARYIGWWSLSDDMHFLLFCKKEDAEEWLKKCVK